MYGNIGIVFREIGNKDSTLHYYNLVKTTGSFRPYHRLPDRCRISQAFRKIYTLYSDIPVNPDDALLKLQKINDSIDQMDIPLDDRAYLYLMTTLPDMKLMAHSSKGEYKIALNVSHEKNYYKRNFIEKYSRKIWVNLKQSFNWRTRRPKSPDWRYPIPIKNCASVNRESTPTELLALS